MMQDSVHAALLFSFLATVLKSSDSDETVQLFVYECLKEGIEMLPEAFPVTYDILIPKMTQVLNTCHNKHIVDAVLSIMKSMYSYAMEHANASSKLTKVYLAKIRFQGTLQQWILFALTKPFLRASAV